MTTLQEAAQRALTDDQINALISKSEVHEYHPGAILEFAREVIAAALASEPQAEQHIPTPDDIDAQDWAGMDGAIAYHLIDRHSESWGHAARLMHAWRDANPPAVIKESLTTDQPETELLVNGLTEVETSASASVAGLVEQPGAVGLSEQAAFEAWCPYKGSPDPRVVWSAAWRAALAAAQPVAAAAERQQAGPRTAISDPNVLIRNESRMGLSGAADGQQAATQGAKT